MQFNKPVFDIPSTLTFFDSKVERGIGFIYGLDKSEINTTLKKYVAGRFVNNKVQDDEFFTFKLNNTIVHPFDENYPEYKATKTTTIYNIYQTVDGATIYYNAISGKFVGDINNASWYFKEEDAQNAQACLTGFTGQIGASSVIIKTLVTNGVPFPCSTFISDNIKDYIQTEEN